MQIALSLGIDMRLLIDSLQTGSQWLPVVLAAGSAGPGLPHDKALFRRLQ